MKIVPYKQVPGHEQILYDLLKEREPHQSISHGQMPTWEEHLGFIERPGYRVWYIIFSDEDQPVGSIYLTGRNEIGVSIFKQHRRKGYASWAIKTVMSRFRRTRRVWMGKFYANINPENADSIALFRSLGYEVLQVTLACEAPSS